MVRKMVGTNRSAWITQSTASVSRLESRPTVKTLFAVNYSGSYKYIDTSSVGGVPSESRLNALIVGNRSSLLQLKNVKLIVKSTID